MFAKLKNLLGLTNSIENNTIKDTIPLPFNYIYPIQSYSILKNMIPSIESNNVNFINIYLDFFKNFNIN
jgi:hypothetical protein